MACKYADYMADAIIGTAVIYDIWRDDLSVPIGAIWDDCDSRFESRIANH